MMRSNGSLQVNRNRLEVSHGVPNLWNSNHSWILPMHFRTSGKINDLDCISFQNLVALYPVSTSVLSHLPGNIHKTDVHQKKNRLPQLKDGGHLFVFRCRTQELTHEKIRVQTGKPWKNDYFLEDGFQNFPSMDSISLKPYLPMISQCYPEFITISMKFPSSILIFDDLNMVTMFKPLWETTVSHQAPPLRRNRRCRTKPLRFSRQGDLHQPRRQTWRCLCRYEVWCKYGVSYLTIRRRIN